jgi:hypothetical protein
VRSYNSLSSQLNLSRPDQILNPGNLKVGMRVGLLFFQPVRGYMRAVHTLLKTMPFEGDKNSWLEAIQNGYHFQPDSYVKIPDMSEVVTGVDDSGAYLSCDIVEYIALAKKLREEFSVPLSDEASLIPSAQFHPYSGMGLAPISTSQSHIGRWQPIATIRTDT